jgi:signal transduction histidine kinase
LTEHAHVARPRVAGVHDRAAHAGRLRRLLARYWVEMLWSVFVVVNTVGILVFADWATVPFHFIWIGLSLLYGWRVWGMPATFVALGSVIVLTGFALLDDVIVDRQAPDELTEIPLMATVFVVMVWYVRRAVDRREQIRRVSEHNLALLQRQRQFVQDASHVLRTPLTIALGHAELLQRSTADPATTRDLAVVIDELNRLTHISDRLLVLAATEQPDFLHTVDTRVDQVVTQVWSRWSSTHPGIMLGALAPVSAPLDPTHVRDALDELVSNAVRHSEPGTPVKLSVSQVDGGVSISVADRGPGIPYEAQARVFDRFGRLDQQHPDGGLGLGLALVKAIAEAHGGHLSLRSVPGMGTTFDLWLPTGAAAADTTLGEMTGGSAGAGKPAAPARDSEAEVPTALSSTW